MSEINPGYEGREHCRWVGCARAAQAAVKVPAEQRESIDYQGLDVPLCQVHAEVAAEGCREGAKW
jgi:hypothetical protein